MNYSNTLPFLSQLLDVYRLVEDQIDMPSVAREVLQGKSTKFCFTFPCRCHLLTPIIICRFAICCTRFYAFLVRLCSVRPPVLIYH
jgi:hypothetical protein